MSNKIETAKRSYEAAQQKLLIVYLDEIKKQFNANGEERRRKLIRGLESVLAGRQENEQGYVFDNEYAILLRNRERLSQEQLAEKIKINRSSLAKYETGTSNLRQMSRPYAQKYLQWLKSQGYNPFNI